MVPVPFTAISYGFRLFKSYYSFRKAKPTALSLADPYIVTFIECRMENISRVPQGSKFSFFLVYVF